MTRLQASIALACIWATVVAACWPSVTWLVGEWFSASQLVGHGPLLVVVAFLLFVRSASTLDLSQTRTRWSGIPLILVLSMVWILGQLADVVVVHTSVIPLLLLAAVFTVFGVAGIVHLGFSILYWYFAFPIWEHVQFIFQNLTVLVVQHLVKIVGVSVVIDGKMIHIPAGSFRVVSGCSGINYIIIALAIASLYGHLFYRSWRPRIILLSVAFVAALVLNWIRVSAIVILGDVTAMQSPWLEDHDAIGWVLFAMALVLLYWFAGKLHADDEPGQRDTSHSVAASARGSLWPATLVAIAAVAAGPAWSATAVDREASFKLATVELPVSRGDWVGPMVARSGWRPDFNGASGESLARYESSAGSVWLYANVYLSQSQDRELINMHNDVAGSFHVERNGYHAIAIGGEQQAGVRELQAVEGSGARWRIWYWYEVDGYRETSAAKTKLRQALGMLRGKSEAGIVAVATLCGGSCDGAGRHMQSFLESIVDGRYLNYAMSGEELP